MHVGVSLPEVPNHWLLMGVVNLTILSDLLIKRRKSEDAILFSQECVHVLRLEVALFYFFTFFHKLNTDFLNVQWSCASQFYSRIASYHFLFPDTDLAKQAVIYGTLLLEGLLPFLLLSRLRLSGVFLASIFHFFLVFDVEKTFYNFSAPMFALLLLFLDRDILQNLIAESPFFLFLKKYSYVFQFLFGGFYIGILMCVFFFPASGVLFQVFGFQLLWFVFGILGVILFWRAWKKGERRCGREVGFGFKGKAWLLVFPAFVLFNGLSPYLGLKTRGAWQMYSNLQIDARSSNHLLIPGSLDLLGYLENSAEVSFLDGGEAAKSFGSSFVQIPFLELQRFVKNFPEAQFSYVRFREGSLVGELSKPLTFLERKWFWFGPQNPQSCVW